MHWGEVDTLASYTLWRESMLLILCKGFSRHLIQRISKRLSRFRIKTSSGRAEKFKTNITMAKFVNTTEVPSKGYATLRFTLSEEAIIEN